MEGLGEWSLYGPGGGQSGGQLNADGIPVTKKHF